MSRTIVGLKGTTATDFFAAGVGILAAATETDRKPISMSVGTDATTDSTATVANGAVVDRVFIRIGTEYPAAATATPSLYHAEGSQALGSAVLIGGRPVGDEVDIPLDIVNASGQSGVFRIAIGETPDAGALTALLYHTGAPVA